MTTACDDKAECGAAGDDGAVDHKAVMMANTYRLCAAGGITLLVGTVAAAVVNMIAVLAAATPFVAPLVFGAIMALVVCIVIVYEVHALNLLPTWTERQAMCVCVAQFGFVLAAVVAGVCSAYIVIVLGSIINKDDEVMPALAFMTGVAMCIVLVVVVIAGIFVVFLQDTLGETRKSASVV